MIDRTAYIFFAYKRFSPLVNSVELSLLCKRPNDFVVVVVDPCSDLELHQSLLNVLKVNFFNRVDFLIHKRNIGLRSSVIAGVNYAIESGASSFLCIEDDIVVSPSVFSFSNNFLPKCSMDSWMCISSHTYMLCLSESSSANSCDSDVFLSDRVHSWVWGTSSEIWKSFMKFYRSRGFSVSDFIRLWNKHPDLAVMYLNDCLGRVSSWAVWFALFVIRNDGLCLHPSKVISFNVGFDDVASHRDRLGYHLAEEQEKSKLVSFSDEYHFDSELHVSMIENKTVYIRDYFSYSSRLIFKIRQIFRNT